MSRPIRPEEVVGLQASQIPDAVFDAFNMLIARGWNDRSSVVKQSDVVAELLMDDKFTRRDIFDKNMLDVEEAYRAQGWVVVYDKPGFNESYEATFTFTQPT